MNVRALAATALAGLLAAASAHAAENVVAQADYPDPDPSKVADDGTELALMNDAYVHIKRAQMARGGGGIDEARAEDKMAADNLIRFVDRYPSHPMHIVFLRMAVERYLGSNEWQAAAETAQRMVNDKAAQPVTKAIGTRYAAGAWQMVAVKEMKSGQIPSLKLVPHGARKGAAHAPRIPDLPWKMFVENTDAYAKWRDADPAAKFPLDEQKRAGADLAQIQSIAAQVEFGYDNMEDAQRRFGALIETYPSRADVMESAIPFYLDTFQFTKDKAGMSAALAKVEPLMAAEARRTAEAAAAPGATDAQKKDAATYAKIANELKESAKGGDYNLGAELMAKGDAAAKEGKAADATAAYKEAAALFEKYAAANKDGPDAPNALFNAALALDRAKDGKRAVAAREQLVASYPDAKVVPQALVLLGQGQWNEGNYAGAAAAYEKYLQRWPDGPQHCAVLQNSGYAFHKAGKKAEAQRQFLAFASDAACAKEDPNTAARLLYEAGKSLAESKKTADAKKVFQQLVALQGVTGVVEKSYQADAAQRIKGMK